MNYENEVFLLCFWKYLLMEQRIGPLNKYKNMDVLTIHILYNRTKNLDQDLNKRF